MTAQRDPDRLIRSFLSEGPVQIHDQVYDAVRTEIDHRRQRAVIGPWRIPALNKLVPVGLGTAAVVVALVAGSQLLGAPSGPGASAEPIASLEPTATPDPTATPAVLTPSPPSAPPLSASFTSTLYGASMSYPEGWTARAATEPWTDLSSPGVHPGVFDWLSHPTIGDGLFLSLASQPIGNATPEEWMAAALAIGTVCTAPDPIEVDGAAALAVTAGDGCEAEIALVTLDGRGYWIELYASNDDPVAAYDRAWFEEVLAAVELHPEDAAPQD